MKELRGIERRYLQLWKDVQEEQKLGTVAVKDAKVSREILSEEYLRKLLPVFADIEFHDELHCYIHRKRCPVSPRQAGFVDQVWSEGAGNTCCPWSRMPGSSKWLDESTLVCLTWIFSLRFYQPDM